MIPIDPNKLAGFLSGAQVGRDKVEVVTIERDQLEVAEKYAALKPHLTIAGRIWADFKWDCKKFQRTREQELTLIDDYIIRCGLEIKNKQVLGEVLTRFNKMKETLKLQEQ